jgi:hypothetical protein
MVPIARFLLRNGVGYREFAEISKLAFVEVASNDYGIRSRKTNLSRVAVLTGLSRKEVAKLRTSIRSRTWKLNPDLSKPGKVLSVWYTDPRFLDSRGRPRALHFESEHDGTTFSDLVKASGGDVPPRAMLKELLRAGSVVEQRAGNYRAVKREFAPRGTDPFLVERFGQCIHDLADTMAKNMMRPEPGERLYEFRAWNDEISPDALETIREAVADRSDRLLKRIDTIMARAELTSRESATKRRCGVGIYYFEDSRDTQDRRART